MSWTNRKRLAGRRVKSGLRQRRKPGQGFSRERQLRFEALEMRRLLSLSPIISEVAPAGGSGIVDTLGDTADWLEIYNPDPTTSVNLTGWSISYLKTGGSTTKTWNFPTNTILGPGEFRVIFGDSNMTSSELSAETAFGELDTGFNLSKDGATLSLWNNVTQSGTAISTLTYPALASDTSYGPLTTVSETDVVAAGATASYYCPTSNSLGTTWTQPSYNATSWASGPTGLGFCNVNGYACTSYVSNYSGTIGSVETAEQVMDTPSEQGTVYQTTQPDLNFMGASGGGGWFTSLYNAFPGTTSTASTDVNYVMQATGTLTITASQAGYYTFGVNSDDGFLLNITGASFNNGVNATTCSGSTLEYDGGRPAGDTLGTTYLAAGNYPISLLYFQGMGGWSLEFYAAKESSSSGVSSFDSQSILVGATTATTASGGTSTTTTPLQVTSAPLNGVASSGAYSAAIATNVKSAVTSALATDSNAGTSLYTIIPFNAPNLSSLTSLTLKMKYADGYVAWLNGVEVASENVPTPLPITSITYSGTTATATLSSAPGFVVGQGVLIAGATGTNANLYNGTFAITAVSGDTFRYTMTGTPTANASGTMTATSLAYNALAHAEQTSGVQATTYEDVDLTSFLNSSTTGHLTATGNVLAIQVLMASYSEQQMLVLPELAQMTSVVSQGDFIYSTPSPGAPNTLADMQASISFSQTDGLYSASFPLTITSNPAGEPIYYTTDNTAPMQAVTSITYSGTTATATTPDPVDFDTGDEVVIAGASPSVYDGTFPVTVSTAFTSDDGIYSFTYTLPTMPSLNASGADITATHGTLYTGPITISTTTVVQASIVLGSVATPYQTETYVFPAAVAVQSATPSGYPTVWDGTINSQDISADYAMSSVPGYTTAQIAAALSSLPSMSLVTSNTNMWAPSVSIPIPRTTIWRCRARWNTSIRSAGPRPGKVWRASPCTAAWAATPNT